MNKYAKRYLIDAMSGMAQGLFCSLLIGTIVKTLGQQLLRLGENAFFKFPLLCLGLHGNSKGFYLRNCKTLTIQSDSKSILHTDGELVGNVDSVKFEVLPQKLTILV